MKKHIDLRKRIKAAALMLSVVSVISMTSCNAAVTELKNTIKDTFASSEASAESGGHASKTSASESSAQTSEKRDESIPDGGYNLGNIPEYSGIPYVEINNNMPYFEESDYTTDAFEYYAELDLLGRCGTAYANVCRETMPTEKRGDISSVKPTGWYSIKYDFVDSQSLYNRCHLIGYQLTAENANKQNLVTGTRYLNVDGMLPFENMIADYVKETNNHVLYRVTPVFIDSELVCRGIQMEAWSVEDNGDGVCFNVYAYNVQPGVIIDYQTGKPELEEAYAGHEVKKYVINTNNNKFHLPDCSSVKSIKEENKQTVNDSLASLKSKGYTPCGNCLPEQAA